nr:truncated FRIGIDA-like protein 1 isoform X2 [Coffea arabica]
MATATTQKSISKELELVDGKKAKLKSAFEELQAHYSVTNLNWEDLDSYFTSLQSHLLHKFSRLQSQKPDPKPLSQPQPQQPKQKETPAKDLSNPVPARAELKSFCENMDGLGLRNYILDRPRERAAIRVELADAWKYAPDPAKMVVDAVQGLIADDSGSGTSVDLGGLRRVGVVLLEELMRAKVEIRDGVKEKAKAIAAEWKGKLAAASSGSGSGGDGGGEEDGLEKLCFLHMLAAFGLVENDGFDLNELVEYAAVIARYRQAVELCRALKFGDKISDIIQKLIGEGKHLLAVKFIFQFEMTDRFPPVPLLKTYVLDSKKLAQKVRKDGKSSRQSLNEAAAKEISSLKSVIRIIEDHNLESQYSKDILLKLVEKLEKERTSKKRPAPVPAVKAQQQKPNVGKQSRKIGAAGRSTFQKNVATNPTVPTVQQPHMQMAGLLADPYLSTSAAAYGLAGSTPAVAPYGGTSAGIYGLPGTHIDPSVAGLYPSETSTRPSYYDRSVVYGGYGFPPQYHQAYYPQ